MASKKIAGITIELSTDTAKLTKGLDKVAGQFEKVGKSLTKNVTAPIMAIGGASMAAFMKVDEGLDIIVQKTGATGEELESMNKVFENLSSTIPASFEEIGSAVGEVNTRFGATGDVLEEVSGQFIKFAQLNGQDVSTAIDQTQKALTAYGRGVEDASGYLDVMNRVSQQTGVSVDTLQNGIVQNSTAFKEMGLSLEGATVLMGQLEMSGADANTVLGGMRRALKNATSEGKPLEQALSELENSIVNGTDSMDGLTLAYDLFGRSGDQVYAALQSGAISFKDLADASLDAGNSVSDTFEETLDPIDEFKIAMQNLQVVGAKVGTAIMRVLTPAIQKLGDFIKKLQDKWDKLSPSTQNIIVKIGLLAAAIGPVLVVIGKIVSVVSTVIAIGSKLSGLLALLTGPIGAVVAAIAGLVAIGVTLYKNWDTVKAKAEELKNKLSEAWNNIKQKTTEAWNNVKTTVSNAVEGAKQKAQAGWETLKTATSNAWSAIKNNVAEHGGGIKGVISAAIEGYKNIWQMGFNAINNLTGGRLGEVLANIRSKAESIKNAIAQPFESAKALVQGAWEKIKGLFPISLGKIFTGIKLPHFRISGGQIPWGIGGRGVKPSVSIDWYQKAYANAVRFSRPTVLDTPDGFKGFGDGSGAEWVTGERTLAGLIGQAVSRSQIAPELIYQAVKEGAEAAQLKAMIGVGDITRASDMGLTAIYSGNMRFSGAN